MQKILLVLLSFLAVAANASAISQLKAFISDNKTLSANFVQNVSSKAKKQTAYGVLEISRPGKFRWSYKKPYEQLIIGDGKTLWIYDVELAQVTKKPMDMSLGSSPAALLSGENQIERDYILREIGTKSGVEWLSATPKNSENTFNSVSMGFHNNQLVEMELKDSFGNTTNLVFSKIKSNPAIADSQFKFTTPKNADVICAAQDNSGC